MTFILFDGGLPNLEFLLISHAGLCFLGLGDVSAALYGREFGVTKWVTGGRKSTEGSMACFLSMMAFWVALILFKADLHLTSCKLSSLRFLG